MFIDERLRCILNVARGCSRADKRETVSMALGQARYGVILNEVKDLKRDPSLRSG
jgi:hypothetical protein